MAASPSAAAPSAAAPSAAALNAAFAAGVLHARSGNVESTHGMKRPAAQPSGSRTVGVAPSKRRKGGLNGNAAGARSSVGQMLTMRSFFGTAS